VRQGIAEFTHMEVSGSLVLLVATVTALILANSPLAESYARFWKGETGSS
jgi:Na+/H+ antiporter NhaA